MLKITKNDKTNDAKSGQTGLDKAAKQGNVTWILIQCKDVIFTG